MADRSDIDEVRTRIDLVSVIERYVTLKRTGGKLKGLCPFHQEKTPSFTVSPDIGRWYCFGSCAEGGDVFKFVQKIENLSFPEALERLALQANVTLTSRNPRGGDGASGDGGGSVRTEAGEKDRIYKINALALRFLSGSAWDALPSPATICSRAGWRMTPRKTFRWALPPTSGMACAAF